MNSLNFVADDGVHLTGQRWDSAGQPKAVVLIAHGAAEHVGRYDRFARRLNAAGYAALGVDHRGHGTNVLSGLGDFGPRGFGGVVSDMAGVAREAEVLWPQVPLVLFAHSMGSFAAQAFTADHADLIEGLILSGTAVVDELLPSGDMEAGLEAFNAAFEPARTPFDWLSRDDAEVDAYIDDPLCGFDLELTSLATMPSIVAGVRQAERLVGAVRRALPILVISGECDPVVGSGQASAKAVVGSYISAGLEDVQHKIYPGGRHELLNETNRVEVMTDVVAWLDARF